MLRQPKQLFLYSIFPLVSLTQYVPSFNKPVANMDIDSALKAGCDVTVPSNQTLTAYSTSDCSDEGWTLGPLNYYTSTPSGYAFQSVKMSRQSFNQEQFLFSTLGPTMGSYWHEGSNPLQILWGSYPSYCGTNLLNLTWQGVTPFSPTDNSECLQLVDQATLVRFSSQRTNHTPPVVKS